MRASWDHPDERAMFARRLRLSPDANDETLAEAAAEFFDGGRHWIDSDHRPIGTEEDDHFGEPRHHRLAASARARRQSGDLPSGGPAPRTRGRVTFQGSGQSFLDR